MGSTHLKKEPTVILQASHSPNLLTGEFYTLFALLRIQGKVQRILALLSFGEVPLSLNT